MDNKSSLNAIKQMIGIADVGLLYAKDDYDRERYTAIKKIALDLLVEVTDQPLDKLSNFFLPVKNYPTVKVDVRALVLNNEDQVLLAQESSDKKWTLPGGWADVGYSPKEIAENEVREETGLKVKAIRLLAVYDKQRHPHPPEPFYVYKMVFLCAYVAGNLKPGFDMLGAQWFSLNGLPELSTNRILKEQILSLCTKVRNNDLSVYFD
ncbi:ADP-ribose pyrophosphatase [Croceivirga radicis]|uniref:ADP-ribose pyrophosphatase n=1 Tax=Croceivirga radicis TaxID=1929488 RepID=A0A1V6LW55_9FLAO|nr:NUDIX hydrolase [Croceivirga radicis]OQD44423.1 ADP-ribose pyrophosphatase [Croceivirga radicis]